MEKKIRQEGRTVTASRTTSVVSDLKGGKVIPESSQGKRGGNQRQFAVIIFLFELFFFLLPSFFSMLYTSQTYDRSCWPANA